ncbi:MAG: aminotransferase class V-fold PLP-dependent enzyme [Gemmatimonadota bacterium]
MADRYSHFRVADRLLLTGHSHQAWPDVALEGQRRAWLDAAEWVDDKWERVAEQSEAVGVGYRRLMGSCDGDMVLDANTHALVVRFLSALPLRDRPRIVTTDGEFHTIRRQLDRLAEEGVEVVKVAATPIGTLAERVAGAVNDRTACVMVSSVLYATGLLVPDLAAVAEACNRYGAEMFVDAYHHLNVVPFDPQGLERAFVVGGGYKYCQLGEGVCVMRVPVGCDLRPVVTGWFSEFGEVAEAKVPGEVRYGAGAARFAGSTFDPTSHYRAARVFRFFGDEGLDVPLLRAVSRHQVDLLIDTFLGLDADPALISVDDAVPRTSRGGFLGLQAPEAEALSGALRERGVRTDFRGETLRFGPAPYLTDAQVVAAMEALGEVLRDRPGVR